MSDAAKQIAHAISKGHLAFKAGQIRIWGKQTVRPNDQAYELKAATARGNAVELQIQDEDGHAINVSVFDPAGFAAAADANGKQTLTIDSASRVLWDPSQGSRSDEARGKQSPPALLLIQI